MSGSIVIKVGRSTQTDLIRLLALLRDHPGDHEAYIQIEPKSEHPLLPIQLMCRPSLILEKEVSRLFGSNSFQIIENQEFGNTF